MIVLDRNGLAVSGREVGWRTWLLDVPGVVGLFYAGKNNVRRYGLWAGACGHDLCFA